MRSFGRTEKGKGIGWRQDTCVMGARALFCGNLWVLAAPSLGRVVHATSVPSLELFTYTKVKGDRDLQGA